jgi:hypothetical protein
MKKDVELVMIPTSEEKESWKIGTLLQYIHPEKTNEGYYTKYNEKHFGVEHKYREVEPYLICDDGEITLDDELVMFSVKGELLAAGPTDLMGPAIDWVKKIIAIPEQIGWMRMKDSSEEIEPWEMEVIMDNRGKCQIELEDQPDKFSPDAKLIDGKVIMSIQL